MIGKKRKSFDEFLIEKKILKKEDLARVSEESKKTGDPLRKTILKMKLATEEDFVSYYTTELNIPRANLKNLAVDPKILEIIPEEMARKDNIIPISKNGDILMIAMADPLNIIAIDELRLKTGNQIEPLVETETNLKKALDQHYGSQMGSIEDVIKTMDSEAIHLEENDDEGDTARLADMAEEAPVIKLVNTVISQALKDGASDIHVEPEEKVVKIRNRIDGILHDTATIPKHLQAAVLSRIKIMSDMNIAVKRSPQDGRFQIKKDNAQIDFRVSCFPTIYGENIVMRILDPTSVLLGLEQLGFSEDNLKQIKSLIKKPHGIILVTGPTGSGKTTTLYSALNAINEEEINIITVEDPVEYRLPGIRQSQINPKAGMTFASGLRSILRQDPDVIMVGEIRDLETSEIAIQAALTGHLVFSTLHTNDAPGALNRLIDMGIEPFLISSSIIAVLAQRLVRTICPNCKKEIKVTEEMVKDFADLFPKTIPSNLKVYKGEGCGNCRNTGYRGRLGIYEFMTMSEKIKEMVIRKASSAEIAKQARAEGMKGLREDGLDKVLKGQTTFDEVVRVTMVD